MFGGFGGDGNPFGVNFNLGNFPQRFDEHYRVYPVSFCDKAHLEDGDKILLPPSALETLARLHIEYPMLFKIINEGANRHSHCGVLEFSAPEGSCYMPYWMMQNLFVKEGGIINIQNISLPKASFVKIRPQSQDFLDITNQRAVLEASLRKFSCLTIGDTICIKYNNKNFLLDVREVRPAPAACIIETDCEVDFEAPADYVPPPPVRSAAQAPPAPSDAPYGGVSTVSAAEVAKSVRGKTLGGGGLRLNKKSGEQSSTDAATLRAARLRRYESFHGTGQSLSGLTSTAAPVASGNRLGGRSTSGVSAAAAKEEEEEQKEEKPSAPKAAVPFQGEGRRLSYPPLLAKNYKNERLEDDAKAFTRELLPLCHIELMRVRQAGREEKRPEDQKTRQQLNLKRALAGAGHAVTHLLTQSAIMSETSTSSASSTSSPPSDAVTVTKPSHSMTTSNLHENENDGSDWVQKWSLFYQRMLDKFLRETYGHAVSVQVLAVASTALLLSCALYFLSPLLEDDYHIYKQYLPWVHYLDYSKYNSFVVDHVVVFLAISLPMSWLLLVNITYSGLANRLELALLLLRIACCLTVCFSLTVILTEFLSRRVMIALLSLAYGSLGLVYSWSVPVWRWYLDEASKKGLIAFMPESLQELLLRTSLLEWLTDTSMSEKVQPFLPFLLPLSRAEQNRLLERMPVESQVMLTRPGLMPFLPESMQKALLPSDPPQDTIENMQQLTLHNDSSESSSSDDNGALMQQVKKLDLPPTAAAGFDFHRPEVKASNALAAQSSEEVLIDIISNRVWNGCKQIVQMPASKTLNRTASVSTALLVLQLYASRRSRRMFVTTLQFLLTSALGSVAACAVLLRTIQLTSTRWPNRPVPLLRYAQQYLLRNRSAQPQLVSDPESDSSQSKLRKVATSASVVLAVVYAMRKLRG